MAFAKKKWTAMKDIVITCNEKLNILQLDEQHSQLADIMSTMFAAFDSQNHKVVRASFKKLVALIRIHFDTEERLMKETKFLGYISHKLEHDRFFNKTSLLYNTYCKDISTITQDKMEGLKNWFFNHIEINDKKCGAHFVKQGIK